MAFSRLRYEAEKEREKKQAQQSNKGSQSDKERVETPAPSRTTSSDSVLRREAQKEREKKAVAQTPKVSADDLYNNAVNVALQVSRNATEPPANATPTELTTGRDPRDATFWDLTVNSFKQGYYNSAYGQESYKEMTGAENEKDYYENLLLGKDYQFETDKWWEKSISGAAGLIGQQARQWSDPRSLAAGTAAAGAVALAGQAGPQIALPEEIITVPGAFFAGMQAGSTATNYEIEAGLAYNEMIENGISEDTAKKIALAVGGVNAALEMVQMDELGKAFKILDNSNATKGVTKRLIDELKDRGIDVATETVQEVMQEGSTILGTQAASKLEKGELAYNSDEVLGRLGDTALSSALSFGLMNAPAAGMNMAGIANTNKNLGKVGSEYQVAAEDVIAEGLTFNENSDAYKVATELRAKQEAGETITDAELGRAVTANQQAINNEQRIVEANRDPQETLEELARETVAERNKTAQSEDMGQETSAQRASVPYNAMSVENPVRQAAIAESKNMERRLGYGQEGMKAFNDILETSNKTVDQVRQEFQTAYEAGKINLSREKVGVLDSVRETAYNAGRLDYIQTLKTDKVRAEGVTINSKAGFDPADMSTDNLPQGVKPAARPADVTDFQVKTVDTLAKKLGVNVRIVTGIKGNAEIRGNTVLISANFNRKQAGQNRSIVFYAAHEIGMHRLIKLAPAEGRAFINAIIEDANANLPANMTTDTEQRQAEYAEQNVHLSVADAMEEVAADKIFGLYDSEEAFAEAIDRIVNGKDEKAKQGARKFKDILDDIVHKLKQVVAKLTGKEKAEAQQTLSEVEQLRDMWEKALEAGVNKAKNLQATKNAAQKSDVVQHSIDPDFAQQMLSWDGKSKRVFTLGTTSAALQSIGVRDGKIVLYSGKARDILTNPDHDMDQPTLAKIPEVLEHPIAILKSQQITKDNDKINGGNTSRLVIFGTIEDTKGVPVAVVLELLPTQGGKVLELSVVASAYGKTSNLSGFVQSSEVLYLDENKKRTTSWLQSVGVQFPSDAINYGSMGKVTYSNGKVNIQGVPFSQISGATYVAAPKQAPPMADWQKKLADLHSKMTESEDDGSQKSLKVTDKKTLDFLNEQIDRGEYDPVKNPNGGYIKVYRSFQVIDGKLYAPMNAVDRDTDGKNHRLGYNSQYRVWEMATESPEIAQRYMDANPDAPYAKFDLDGVDNKTGGVAYNPYLHASNLVLNDQFAAAYRRNLITVECYVPVSEANGAYKAQYAKDATGWVEWKPGGVAGKLMKQKPEYTRKLFVSRYMLPVREVKAPELASMYKEYLDGTNIKVPWNVVTPELRRELVKAGVGIDYKDVYQSTDKKTGEKKYAKFDEVFPGERQYSLKDSDYMKAVESGDMETAQKMVDAAAAAAMPESKIKTENGDIRVVYHGTNTGDFNVFNPDYIGMSSGDDGFFGMGFYFAYSEGEASYYGAKRIIPAYLNLKNPFNFDRELQTYNGKKARSGYAPDAVALMNFANKFPDIANSITIGVVEKGDDEVKDLPLREFAKAFKDVIDNKTFEHQELTNEYGEKETLVVADPEVHEYEYNGVKHSYRDYGFQKRFWGEANDLDVAYEYLSNTVYSYVDMLSRTRLILDNNREFTAALKEMGYDGAIQSEYGDEAVAFYPHQIKTADPVAYDDDGNVIPLSKRFDSSNDDIRFSLKDTAGRELTQEQAAYFKNSKIVDKNGNLKIVYHGSGAKFTEFSYDFMSSHGSSEGQGFYFTDKKEMAQGYERDGGQLLEGYLNITKPLSDSKVTIKRTELTKLLKAVDPTGDDVIINYDPSGGMGYPSKTWYNRALAGTVAQMMEYNESDSEILADIANSGAGTEVVLQKVRELLGYDGYIVEGKYDDAAVYVAFTSEQFKNADNQTPTSDPDIRFSLKSNEDLLKQNAKLKEVNQELRDQFKTTKFAKVDKKALRQFAKQLLKDYQSGADIDETLDTLDSVFTYIANGENGETAVWEEAYKRTYDAAVSILSNSSTLNDELFQAYKQLRDDLKNTGITIDKKYDHDLVGYESINEFRKANYGRIKIVNDGTPVDMMYQELAWRYPEFFDEGTYSNQADQLSHIAEVLDSLQPTEVNPYSSNMRESATWLANDIMERYFELPQAKPTFADKAQQKLTKQVIKDAEKMERLREQKNERIASLIEERRAKVKEVTQKERQKRDEKVREIKDRFKAKEAKMSENKKASILRERIIRHTQGMSQKLLHPTDKQHVPENLRKPVAAVLDAINLESQYTVDPVTGKRHKGGDGDPTKRTKAFQELRKAYQDIIKDDSADIVVDPAIEAMLDLVVELQDVKLADMNLRQLQTVWDVVRVVEHTVNTAGKLLSETKYKRTVEWASAMVNDTATRRSKRGGKASAIRIDMENPYTFFSHYGESGKAVFRMLRDAQDKQQTMVNEVQSKVRDIVDPKTVRKLEKEVHELTTERGDKLTLTTAQIMDIYLLTKRQQAHDHLLSGGIVQPEVKSKNIKRGTDAILLSAADLSDIVSKLDAKQREIANKLQEMTRTTLADYGNEASLKAYGYKKFTGSDYWPIKSAREGVHSNVEKGENNTRSIKNIGLAKSVIPHANNPLDIGGVFQTFASHAADMTDYAAWLCPMEDANRLFNFQFRDDLGQRTGKTIKGMLDRVGGKGAQQYWHNLMEDIQNGIKTQADNTLIQPINKVIGNVRGASVGANIRVIVQQPTAILRAAAVLSPFDMTKGLAAGGGWKTALQHSPIAQRKNMGGFDISSPMQMREILYDSQTPLQRFNNAMMWGAGKADALTWGRIWNACEWAVKRDRKDLIPRTDAFYEAVNERFTEVVDQSQVVDGVLQRSQLMRSNNALLNQATAFMGEPTMTMNMMLRAYDGLVNETDKSKRGKAIKVFGRTAMALLVTNAVNAVMQSFVDAWRDDEDDEYWEKLKNAFFGVTGEEETAWEKATAAVLGGNLGNSLNPVGYVPFAKDILSILQGYNVTRADADVMGDIIDATTTFIESVGGDGKRTVAYATKNLAQQVGKVFGISAPNILRDVWGVVRTIALETGNIPLQYEMEKAIYKVDNQKNASQFVDILYKAYQTDKEVYERIYNDMADSGFSMEKIQSQMESRMKKDQGVTKVDELEQRYLNPKQQSTYDSKLKSVSGSNLWRSATAEQKEEVEEQLYNLTVGNDDGEKLQEKISEGQPYGLTETEYLLYDLALSMVDQPNKSGELGGTPTNAEKAAAIAKVGGFGNGEIAYLWDTKDGYEVYAAGLDMRIYVERLGSGESVNVEKLIEADGVVGEDNYYDFLDMMDKYDKPTESGKMGTFNQDEATAAISAMSGLTKDQRAWLWQSVNKGWSEKNNPWK